MKFYKKVAEKINPVYTEIMKETLNYVDNLAKPIGSFGQFDDKAVKISGITGCVKNNLYKKRIIVMAADNGAYEEVVRACPQSVTAVNDFLMDIRGV